MRKAVAGLLIAAGIGTFLFGVWMFIAMPKGGMFALMTLIMGILAWIAATVAILAGVALSRSGGNRHR